MIGIFPVLSETPERLVAGFDDTISIFASWSMSAREAGRQVTATTLVRTHNWLGRTYLARHHAVPPAVVRACCSRLPAETAHL